MRTITRLTAPLSRLLAGHRWFPLWAVLHHRGRVSGKDYAIPVVARRTRDGFVIPMPFGDQTQWARNVEAAGRCTIRWRGQDYAEQDPQPVDRDAVADAFSTLERSMMGPLGIRRFLVLHDAAAAA
jgi:deazaflavin-dependent oxidoreductase (nitroreductase family)